MREFFGFGGYLREPEGAWSWQHLLFVGSLLAVMIILAVALGLKNKDKPFKTKNLPLVWAALMIDGFEILKIVIFCVAAKGFDPILSNLPLFLCSITLIALPIAAFAKGRLREAATDFVCIFGILAAVFGTIGAAQNYNAYPVLSFHNVVSGITHTISGFASLYILFAKMAGMKKKNIGITFGILFFFCAAAYIANVLIDYNYMFLMNHDGTPYVIFYNLVGGNPVLYPLIVVGLFVAYIIVFYCVFFLFTHKKEEKTVEEIQQKELITK